MAKQGKKVLRKRTSLRVEIPPPPREEATPDAVKNWVVASYKHLTAREQAEMLGISYGNLVALRDRLAKAKRIDFSKRAISCSGARGGRGGLGAVRPRQDRRGPCQTRQPLSDRDRA